MHPLERLVREFGRLGTGRGLSAGLQRFQGVTGIRSSHFNAKPFVTTISSRALSVISNDWFSGHSNAAGLVVQTARNSHPTMPGRDD